MLAAIGGAEIVARCTTMHSDAIHSSHVLNDLRTFENVEQLAKTCDDKVLPFVLGLGVVFANCASWNLRYL